VIVTHTYPYLPIPILTHTSTYIGASQRMDPYVSLSMEGKAVKMVKRTAADKDGGGDPVWQDEVCIRVCV
jgi:hypothetical protein